MKIIVHFNNDRHVVPCGKGEKTIDWLINETLSRATTRDEISRGLNEDENDCLQARIHKSHGILFKHDKIKDVLDDNQMIYLGTKADSSKENMNSENGDDSKNKDYVSPKKFLVLDGNSLTTSDLLKCGEGVFKIQLSDLSRKNVKKSRDFLDNVISENKVVYGVNTGFGKFARVVIPNDKLKELQVNLIRSHAACVGEALTLERSRSLLALRINVLAKGFSGISLDNLEKMIAIFNSGCVSYVPEKGTVGASGDLGPLAHLALGMLGEGKMWGPKTGWTNASMVLSVHGLKPLSLGPKEGLALINGTQLIGAIGNEALERAKSICRQADIIAALSLEVLKGSTKAYNEEIHKVRPHRGQIHVAGIIRSLLHSEVYPSEIAESHRFCDRVQDAYTLRCCPQVHGIVHDTISFVHSIISIELNSATDNPMVFADLGETMSGGNFHGEYPAKAMDYLAIGIHELANMSERRLERLINPAYSELPAFLSKEGGLNSGFMIAQCTAAALVSENKVLTHPSSVDSLSTSAGTEDHVSMGGFAARKAVTVVEHVEYVLAIELLAACQGIEFLRPLKTTKPLEAVYRLVRSEVANFNYDRFMAPDIETVRKMLREGKVWKVAQPYMEHYENYKNNNKSNKDFVPPESPTGYSCPPSPESQFSAKNLQEQQPPVKKTKTN